MARIELHQIDKIFATRERARNIIAEFSCKGSVVHVDFADVSTSPSFVNEILVQAARQFSNIVFEGCDEQLIRQINQFAEALGVTDRVSIADNRIPA